MLVSLRTRVRDRDCECPFRLTFHRTTPTPPPLRLPCISESSTTAKKVLAAASSHLRPGSTACNCSSRRILARCLLSLLPQDIPLRSSDQGMLRDFCHLFRKSHFPMLCTTLQQPHRARSGSGSLLTDCGKEGEHRSWCQTSRNMPNQKLLLSGKKCDVTESR